jgi:hypothetical protein
MESTNKSRGIEETTDWFFLFCFFFLFYLVLGGGGGGGGAPRAPPEQLCFSQRSGGQQKWKVSRPKDRVNRRRLVSGRNVGLVLNKMTKILRVVGAGHNGWFHLVRSIEQGVQ